MLSCLKNCSLYKYKWSDKLIKNVSETEDIVKNQLKQKHNENKEIVSNKLLNNEIKSVNISRKINGKKGDEKLMRSR